MAIDEAAWPLVKLRWTGRGTDDELTAFLARLDAWLDRRERFGLMIDARGALGLTSDQRRRVVAHMKAKRLETARYLVQALVHDNAILRTLALVVEIVVPPLFPSKAFAIPEAAQAWLQSQLALPRGEIDQDPSHSE